MVAYGFRFSPNTSYGLRRRIPSSQSGPRTCLRKRNPDPTPGRQGYKAKTPSQIRIISPRLITLTFPNRRPETPTERRHSGRSGSPGFTGGQYSEAGPSADNKMALTDFGSFRPVVPNAPPAYEKIASGPLPPPYSP
ncbi:melanoma antigen recognized by T-cells 1 [Lates japonicus]|uniref:Melanoma antigen recognized by T-cells 1 n=1 Tax=Lates japonicus TaxID=270547 RepID=A0AAD3MKC2_LATJO|nr:melanoma antigen recognized by T-cells 1 [Lates japonicus]